MSKKEKEEFYHEILLFRSNNRAMSAGNFGKNDSQRCESFFMLGSQKQRLDVAVEQIGSDVFRNDSAVLFQSVGIAAAELSGDFEADV